MRSAKHTDIAVCVASFLAAAALLVALFASSAQTAVAGNTSTANAVGAVNIIPTCFISLSPNTINFGALEPGGNHNTNELVQDLDSGGNVNANVVLEGTNWISGSNSFYVTNTLWDSSNDASFSGNALLLAPGSVTPIVVPPNNVPANIYFGLSIPQFQAVGIYTQNILVFNSC